MEINKRILDAEDACRANGLNISEMYNEYANTTGSEVDEMGDIWDAGVDDASKEKFLAWLAAREITDLYEEAEPFSVDMEQLEQWAVALQTSIEVAEAIMELAHMCAWDPDEIWEDPSPQQFTAVMARAWELADDDDNELHWGEETMVR